MSTPSAAAPGERDAAATEHHPRLPVWLAMLVAGAVAWIAATGITIATEDAILVPTIFLLGSFLVPVCTVVFVLTRADAARVPAETLLVGFVIAGGFGVAGSALLEVYLLPTATGTFVGIGLIEEGTKALVILVVARHLRGRSMRGGLALGAAVGAGFASFESAGYAMQALILHSGDHPVLNVVATEASRAILAPFGHITWTALMGGALFAASPEGRWRISRGVVGTFVGVVALHALWDASYGLAIIITQGLVGDGWDFGWPRTKGWAGTQTGGDAVRFQAVYDTLIGINAFVGAWWAVHRWRRSGPQPAEEAAPEDRAVGAGAA